MDNKDFKVRIVDLYKGVDKPIINNLYEDNQTKEVMKLSEKSDLLLLKKDKNKWVLKDKRKLLKEIDMVKNRKVREFTSSISKLGKNSPNINLMKESNEKMISDLESIDNLKKSLNNDEMYLRLQNLSSFNYLEKDNKKDKQIKNNSNIQNGGNNISVVKPKIQIIDSKIKNNNNSSIDTFVKPVENIKSRKTLSDISQLSESEDYIEIFSNQK